MQCVKEEGRLCRQGADGISRCKTNTGKATNRTVCALISAFVAKFEACRVLGALFFAVWQNVLPNIPHIAKHSTAYQMLAFYRTLFLLVIYCGLATFGIALGQSGEGLNLEEVWTGVLNQPNGPIANDFGFWVQFYPDGRVRTRIDWTQRRFFAVFEGRYTVVDDSVFVEEAQIVEQDTLNNQCWCLKSLQLKIHYQRDTVFLSGGWKGACRGDYTNPCSPGNIRLMRTPASFPFGPIPGAPTQLPRVQNDTSTVRYVPPPVSNSPYSLHRTWVGTIRVSPSSNVYYNYWLELNRDFTARMRIELPAKGYYALFKGNFSTDGLTVWVAELEIESQDTLEHECWCLKRFVFTTQFSNGALNLLGEYVGACAHTPQNPCPPGTVSLTASATPIPTGPPPAPQSR